MRLAWWPASTSGCLVVIAVFEVATGCDCFEEVLGGLGGWGGRNRLRCSRWGRPRQQRRRDEVP